MSHTTVQKPTAGRGGMSANAFGGNNRLDQLDLSGPNVQPERLLWLTSFEDAAQNYLFWGLGSNGTDGQEFWYATQYFFFVQACKTETWQDTPRSIKQTYRDDATRRRTSRAVIYSDANLMFMCLDNLWDYLQFPMTLDTFRANLMVERRGRIASNWDQIADYLDLPGAFERWEHALVGPTEPEEVEAILVHFDNKNRRAKARHKEAA